MRRQLVDLALPLLLAAAVPVLLITAAGAAGPPVFINEIHYDNTGIDAGEFVEIAGPAGTDLTGWTIVLYNGSGGASYDTDALSGTIPDQQNGFGTVAITYPSNGIQNGSPDGIALVDASNTVVQFLSYEGTVTATNGPANGMTSVDIGVSEAGTEVAGLSLQLQGTGSGYDDFTWTAPAAHTSAAVNTGQTFSGVTPSPTPTPTPSPTPTPTPTPIPVVSDVVISQVYGGGGNSGATLRNDFVDLFNRGEAAVDLTGWSVQIASATAATWQVTPLTGSIPPGGYYLVQQAAGAGGTTDLPAPDAVGTTSMGATSGKVALVNHATALADVCPASTSVRDIVGYGATPNCFEGTGRAPAPSNTTADLRGRGGCQDTNDNAADFATGSPAPRNSASAPRDCTPVARTIPEIQGPGGASPFANTEVTTSGIVTALHQRFASGSYLTDGFYVQSEVSSATDPDSDGDPATAEGLFVFTSTPPGVAIGDRVTVSGGVVEFFDLTQIGTTLDRVTVDSSAHALPPAAVLTPAELSPGGTLDQLERFEAMRVQAGPLVSIAPSNSFGEIETVLSGTPRAFREPGIEISRPLPPASPCCVPRFDENPERLMIDTDGRAGSSPLVVTSGVMLGTVQGPLDYSFGRYKVLPDAAPTPSANVSATPVPVPLPGELTVASANLLNLFTTNPDFAGRAGKASLAIRTVLHSPDVIGVQEVGDLATLQALADRLNTDTVAGGGANPTYQAYLIEGDDDTDQDIDVGFLVKASRVQVVSVTQEGRDATYTNPLNGLEEPLNDRPPLVLRATAGPAAPGNAFTVVVNHLRSLIDVDQDPGDGPRVREKRRKQAEFLAGLLQTLQAENVVSVGDYNAFQFNDGYVDVLGTIKGQPTPSDNVVLASPDLLTPDLTDLVETSFLPAEEKYSYVFEGNAQTLDHVLVNASLLPRVTRFAYARNNADFPTSFASDFTRTERISDHDHPVAYFALAPADLIFADGFESVP